MNLLHLRKREKKKYCAAKNDLQYNLQYSLQYNLQYSLQNNLQYSPKNSSPYSQIILMSMVLVYLLSLPLVFVYSLHILKIKNKSMITRRLNMSKERINHQNDVLCFRFNEEKILYNKWLVLIGKKNIKDSLTNGLIITIGVAGIFYGLKMENVKSRKHPWMLWVY